MIANIILIDDNTGFNNILKAILSETTFTKVVSEYSFKDFLKKTDDFKNVGLVIVSRVRVNNEDVKFGENLLKKFPGVDLVFIYDESEVKEQSPKGVQFIMRSDLVFLKGILKSRGF